MKQVSSQHSSYALEAQCFALFKSNHLYYPLHKLSVDMEGWEFGNFNKRGKLQKRRKGCDLRLGPKKYGVIVDSNAFDATAVPKSPMTILIDELENDGICVYESPFVFIGDRLVDRPGIDDPNAIDSGSDRVVLSDDKGFTVDMVKFDTFEGEGGCGTSIQDTSLERVRLTGPSDCSNFQQSNSGSSTPGQENSVFEQDECDCDLAPPPRMRENIIITGE